MQTQGQVYGKIKRIVGIDPGEKTGVVMTEVRPQKILMVETKCFWSTYEWLSDGVNPLFRPHWLVVVEDGGQNSPMFHKAANRAARDKTAMRVGGNNRESVLLARGIEKLGFPVVRLKPGLTKKSADYVRQLTGYTGRTGEHNRDALMMIWGLNPDRLLRADQENWRSSARR